MAALSQVMMTAGPCDETEPPWEHTGPQNSGPLQMYRCVCVLVPHVVAVDRAARCALAIRRKVRVSLVVQCQEGGREGGRIGGWGREGDSSLSLWGALGTGALELPFSSHKQKTYGSSPAAQSYRNTAL